MLTWKIFNIQVEYLVKWKDSWIWSDELNCPHLIREFNTQAKHNLNGDNNTLVRKWMAICECVSDREKSCTNFHIELIETRFGCAARANEPWYHWQKTKFNWNWIENSHQRQENRWNFKIWTLLGCAYVLIPTIEWRMCVDSNQSSKYQIPICSHWFLWKIFTTVT